MKFKNPRHLIMRAIGRSLTKDDLYNFNAFILKYPDICERIHRPMCEHFQLIPEQSTKDFAILLEPRGFMKTTFCAVGYSCWMLCKDPNYRILIYSESHEKAMERLSAVKLNLQYRKLIPFVYSDLARLSGKKVMWKKETITVFGRTSVDMEPSIDTGGRGMDKTGKHYDVWIVDDIENERTVRSQVEMAATKDFLRRLLLCTVPGSMLRVIGTIWADGDMPSMVVGKIPEYKDDFDSWRRRIVDVEDENGHSIYPEIWPDKELARMRKMLGDYIYSCNMRNNPILATGNAFPPANTMYWYGKYVIDGTAKFLQIEKVTKRGDPNYEWKEKSKIQITPHMLVDPSGLSEGLSHRISYTAIIIAAKDARKERIWVIDAIRIKTKDPFIIINLMLKYFKLYDPVSILVEDHGWQRSIAPYFDKEAKKQNIYALTDTFGREDRRSKDERIMGLSPYWKSDALFIPGYLLIESSEESDVRMLREELYRHPVSNTKDLADALSRINDVQYGPDSESTMDDILEMEAEYCDELFRGKLKPRKRYTLKQVKNMWNKEYSN